MEFLPGRTGEKYEITRSPARTPDNVRFTPLTAPTGSGNPTSRPVIPTLFQPPSQLDVDSKTAGNVRWFPGDTVAPTTSPSTDPLPRFSTEQLRELNPKADPANQDLAYGSWVTMFQDSGFTAPIPGMTGLVTTKAISLGGGMSLRVGTKVSDEFGIERKGLPSTQPGGREKLQLDLPSGKTLTLTPERQNGVRMTRLTFYDGRFFRFVGSPFLNPKTGTLTRVQQVDGSPDAPSYRMFPSLTGNSLGSTPARNGAMSGKEAEAALQNSLR